MAIIHLQTFISAPIARVFDLSRSIDAHRDSAEHTSEVAVAGVTSGLLEFNEEVTWQARHFGVTQRLRVKMSELTRPTQFRDVMLEGAFARMSHLHLFESRDGGTLMIDQFEFKAPWGVLGAFAEWLFLTNYMRRFLVTRNAVLKRIAESEDWKKYLENDAG